MYTQHSDNPVFLLLKALITGQKIFYATGDGDVNQKTIVCTDFTSIADQDGNQIHIVDPNSSAHDQTRDIEGDTTSGTITVKTALGCKITENTAFIVTGIRSTPVEVANLEAWIKTALGTEWDGTPDLYDVLVTGGIPTWPAAADIGDGKSFAEAVRAILTSMVGGDDFDAYTAVNNVANTSINAIFQNFAKLFAADSANIFNPTIQGSARTDLELALAAFATYISASGAAFSVQVNNQTARTNLEQVWEDYLAVIGCDTTNVFNPSIGGSARTTLDAALAAVGTIVGDPTSDTLTSITTKWGNIARSLDLILGARWDSSSDLGTDIANIITAISAIQNNTRFTAAVPTWMCKPDAGNEAFRVSSNLYDTEGNMEDPVNNEILVRIIKDDGTYITATLYKDNAFVAVLDNPTDITTFPVASGWRAMEREAAGKFFFFNKVANDATEESLTVEFGWTEGTKTNYQSRSTEIADMHGDLAEILADIGNASAASLGSIYGILGNPSASVATTLLDGIDGRTNTKTLNGLLGVPDNSGKAIYTNIGDYQAQTNLQTLLAALGIPDTSGKPLYTCLVTDRLDHATHGLAAQNTYHWNKDISGYTGVKAGTYLKTLYDDWLNGGRLDLILDIIAADTIYIADGALPASPVAGSLARFIASGGTALGTPLPDSRSLYDIVGIGYVHDAGDFTHSIRRHLRRGLAGANATDVLAEADSLYGGLIGNINAVNRAAGKQQIANTTEDLNQVIGTYDLFTGTTQDVLLESILIRMPNIVAGGAITSISIQTDDATPQVLLSAADGAVANLTAEAQLAWQNFNAPILIKVGTKVQLTIAGGAHGVAYVCDIVAKTRAVTSGGYLA